MMGLRRMMMAGAGVVVPSLLRGVILSHAPWAYWPLDDPDTPMLDASGNGRPLAEKGGSPTFGQPAIYPGGGQSTQVTATSVNAGTRVMSAAGAIGSELADVFDGDKAWSLGIVIRPIALWDGADPLHIGNFQYGGSQGLWLQLSESGSVRVQAFDGSWTNSVTSPAGAVGVGTAAIVHATRDTAGVGRVYVNGAVVATGALGGADAASNPRVRVSVGGASSGGMASNYTSTLAQDAALYSRALTAAEVLEQAQAAGLA